MTPVAPGSAYGALRTEGQIVLGHDEADDALIAAVRRRAKRDGLNISATRGPSKHLSRSQARTRPWTVALIHPDDPTTIIRPDAEETP